MTRKSLFTVLSVAAVLMLLIAACGDDDDDDDDATSTSPSAGGAPTETRATGDGTAEDGGEDPLVAQGEEIYTSQGCNACHSVDGAASVGPTWQGLLGHEVTLDDGTTVTADEAYIAESIRDPDAKIVEGFQPGLMPKTYANFTDDQIAAIVAYIGSLSE